MPTVSVREAQPRDVSGIRHVARRGWQATYGDEGLLSSETIETTLQEWYAPESVREQIEREDVGYFVAVDDGAVRGYAAGGPGDRADVGVLAAIYVHPDDWGEGIGSRLCDRVESFLAERGIDTLRIRVLAENEIGVRFYRSRGYEVAAEGEVELGEDRVREFVFEGPLSPP